MVSWRAVDVPWCRGGRWMYRNDRRSPRMGKNAKNCSTNSANGEQDVGPTIFLKK